MFVRNVTLHFISYISVCHYYIKDTRFAAFKAYWASSEHLTMYSTSWLMRSDTKYWSYCCHKCGLPKSPIHHYCHKCFVMDSAAKIRFIALTTEQMHYSGIDASVTVEWNVSTEISRNPTSLSRGIKQNTKFVYEIWECFVCWFGSIILLYYFSTINVINIVITVLTLVTSYFVMSWCLPSQK